MTLECPFCGAEVEIEDHDLAAGVGIECEECQASLIVDHNGDEFELIEDDDEDWELSEDDLAAMKDALKAEGDEDDADDLDADLGDEDAEDGNDGPDEPTD